ncbi:hypothetical protein CRE_13452 [Caenorhabditis remanei]|uniref:Uncharacterized protein n=1 Tax=Caenorhabditis remanei TaxID=31234 RepID=E3MR18_CAERE|nr:hypothetical protein CRE_13452 [Caenorhabditis remanei]
MLKVFKNGFCILQPNVSDYNLWNLLIGLFTMLLHHDLENSQRAWITVDGKQMQNSYWSVVYNSSPSSFIGTVCFLTLFIPRLYHVLSVPFFLNFIPLISIAYNQLSIGSGVGLTFGAIHIGRGYGWRITSVVTAFSFLLGPLFTSVINEICGVVTIYLDPSHHMYIKIGFVYFLQGILYCCSSKYPAFFEDYTIVLMNHFDVDEETQKHLLYAVRSFECEAEYSKVVMLSNLLQKRLHRRCSEIATSLVRCPTEVDMKTIGEVVSKYFGVSSTIQNCRITQHVVAPTEKGESIVRFGSPLHRVIELVRKMSESGSAWKINVDNFDKDLGGSNVELCLKNGWLKRRRGGRFDYYVIGKQFKSRDIVREVMEGVMMGGGRFTVADLQKHGVLDAMSVEITIEGDFAQEENQHKAPSFRLQIIR